MKREQIKIFAPSLIVGVIFGNNVDLYDPIYYFKLLSKKNVNSFNAMFFAIIIPFSLIR